MPKHVVELNDHEMSVVHSAMERWAKEQTALLRKQAAANKVRPSEAAVAMAELQMLTDKFTTPASD